MAALQAVCGLLSFNWMHCRAAASAFLSHSSWCCSVLSPQHCSGVAEPYTALLSMQELKALCDAAGYVSKGASQAALSRIRSVTHPCPHSCTGSQEQ